MHSQEEPQTPDKMRYFDTYREAKDKRDESIRLVNEIREEANRHPGVLSATMLALMRRVDESNKDAIELLSSYGDKFLKHYVEPTLEETEESFNLYSGLRSQNYEYRDVCHTKEWDWRTYKTIKTDIATLSVGISSTDSSLTFDEVHNLIRQIWANYFELLKLVNRLSDMFACFENWKNKRENNP
jgi:hypothetical protein